MSWRILLPVSALALIAAAVLGQPSGGPAPRGPGGPSARGPTAGPPGARPAGGPAAVFGARVQYGEITDLNPERRYVQIRSAADGSDQVVVVTDATKILHDETISAAALELGETVVVTGLPVEVEASTIRVSGRQEEAAEKPAGEAAEEGRSAPAPEGAALGAEERAGPPAPARDREWLASARLTGTVVGKDPLCVEVWPGLAVRVSLAADAEVTRAAPADFSVLTVGTQIAVIGERDKFGLLQAQMVRVGGSLMEMVGELMRQLREPARGASAGGGPEGSPGTGLPGPRRPGGPRGPMRPPSAQEPPNE